jgi:hypothetical protein
MGNEKVLTPRGQIDALIGQEDALRRRLDDFQVEEQTRQLSIAVTKQDLLRELRSVDPDLSPKEVVANSKEVQNKYRGIADDLRVAGEALDAAVDQIKGELKKTSGKRKALQDIEHRKVIDAHCQLVWRDFEKFIKFYDVTRDFFYGTLLPVIDEGYALDPRFHVRSQQIGLRTDIYQAIDSLLRPGSLRFSDGTAKLNLAQTLMQLQDMKLDSLFGREPYPEQDSSGASLWPDGVNTQFSNL